MDFSEPPRPPRAESIVPMINVVFLLLIFFLMTSNLVRPEPFEVTPPTAATDTEPQEEVVLFVDKSGRMSFDGAEDTAAVQALAGLQAQQPVVQLRADAELEARVLAGLLRDLATAGLVRVDLVVAPE